MRADGRRTRCPTICFLPAPRRRIAAFYLLTARHLAFNANPMLTSAMLLEKEKAKAAKAAEAAKTK